MEIAGATALVTGASSGIGAAVARALAENGARVALVARRRDRLDAIAASLPAGTADTFICDVRDPAAIAATVEAVASRLGPVDLLVNNAGVGRYRSFLETDPEEVAAILETNLEAVLHCTRAVLPGMLARRRGHVVNVSSIAGRIGSCNHTIYCASKFAVAGFSESLSYELEGTGVGLTLVNPGIIETEFFDQPSFDAFPVHARSRAIPAERVAVEMVRAIRRDIPEITVPQHHAIGIFLKTAVPGLFRRMMRRFA